MATTLEVTTKYCDKCENKNYCYKPCPLVLAALYDSPCEQKLLQMCKKEGKRNEGKNEKSPRTDGIY